MNPVTIVPYTIDTNYVVLVKDQVIFRLNPSIGDCQSQIVEVGVKRNIGFVIPDARPIPIIDQCTYGNQVQICDRASISLVTTSIARPSISMINRTGLGHSYTTLPR